MLVKPTPSSISWRDIENLLISVGAEVREGKGSGVTFSLNDAIFSAHRPHPQKEAKRYQVEGAIRFLRQAGVLE